MLVIVDEAVRSVLKASIKSSNPVLLIGETGVGKTTIIQEEADQAKKTLHRVSLNGSTSVEEIIGKWLAKAGTTYWQDGILLSAMKKGDWIVFDEINAALPEILFALHSLLDHDRKVTVPEKDNEVVRPHKNFRFFANMNPTQDYSGTKDVNMALMSRFAAVLIIDVLDNTNEMKLLVDGFGADPKDAEILVRIAHKLREEKKKDNIFYFCSTRDLIHTIGFIKEGVELNNAIKHSIVNKMSPAEFQIVKGMFDVAISTVLSRGKSLDEIEKDILIQAEKQKVSVKEWESKYKALSDSYSDLNRQSSAQIVEIANLKTELSKKPKVDPKAVDNMRDILNKMAEEASS